MSFSLLFIPVERKSDTIITGQGGIVISTKRRKESHENSGGERRTVSISYFDIGKLHRHRIERASSSSARTCRTIRPPARTYASCASSM